MRTRPNINCLSTEQLHDLREALAGLYALPASDPQGFANLAGFHGGPPTSYCRHGAPGFFTWHRAYLMAFENALRAIRCDVVLPYWDWSSGPSTGVPAACRDATYVNRAGATVANPLYAGPARTGGMTSRRSDIDTTPYDDLASQAQTALGAADFVSFQNQVNAVHGGVHVRTGGDMSNVPEAAFDPIFYLHHANVDRLWAQWQSSHPAALPSGEATWALAPFNRAFSTQWQVGSDVESTVGMGYRYRRWCLWLPPIRLWETIVVTLPPEMRRDTTSARLVVDGSAPMSRSAEIRVFIGDPEADDRTRTIGNPAFAGTIALFAGHADPGPTKPVAPGHSGDGSDHCRECERLGHTHDHDRHVHQHLSGAEEQHTRERIDLELELAPAVGRVASESDELTLRLVAVDVDGRPLKDLPVGEVRLETD